MYKHLLFFICFSLASINCFSQKLNTSQVTWIGIDFSKVQLVGNFDQFSGAGSQDGIQLRDKYFKGWNDVVINEREKYDFTKMLDISNVRYDIDMIYNRNASADVDGIFTYNPRVYSKEDISKIVQSYDLSDINGIAITFIAEELNKSEGKAIYHYVAIDSSTNDIVSYFRLEATPGGFGLRNYWAGSVYDAMKTIRRKF